MALEAIVLSIEAKNLIPCALRVEWHEAELRAAFRGRIDGRTDLDGGWFEICFQRFRRLRCVSQCIVTRLHDSNVYALVVLDGTLQQIVEHLISEAREAAGDAGAVAEAAGRAHESLFAVRVFEALLGRELAARRKALTRYQVRLEFTVRESGELVLSQGDARSKVHGRKDRQG